MILRFAASLLLTFLSFGCAAPSGSSSGSIAWSIYTDFPSRPTLSNSTDQISAGTIRIQTASLADGSTGESFTATRATFPKPLTKAEQDDVAEGITKGLLRGFGGSGKVTARRSVHVAGKQALRMTIDYAGSANTTGEYIIVPDGDTVYSFVHSRRKEGTSSPASEAFLRNIRRR
ncbi:MAG: hypothetical protein EOP83_04145 [Verrucomicrobiaceae bacterium]|nr:MAG: hypothetical protein EOP83_04145 [Verrucomicrobiaceae bacterium]